MLDTRAPIGEPSDALVELAAALCRCALPPSVLGAAFAGLDPVLDAPEEWRIPGAALVASIQSRFGRWPPAPPETASDYVEAALALQRLDRWHRPLLADQVGLERLPEHEAVLDRAALLDRYNADATAGTLIARAAPDRPFPRLDPDDLDWDAAPTPYAIVASLLDICAFLPGLLLAGDPDDENLPPSREVRLAYRRFPASGRAAAPLSEPLRVAVAPVVEREDDAVFWSEDGRYAIRPCVPFARLAALIAAAIDADAHLLFLPEMTLDGAHLGAVAQAIREARRRAARAAGTVPSLRLVLAGVVTPPAAPGGRHRNHIAAIDGDGRVLFEQEKLSHWNLSARQLARFGLDGCSYPVPLREDTAPGREIVVAELPGIGRIMALICADMAQDMPGDWVADHLGLDVLFAPIMDGSTCWTQGRPPWIIARAHRAATRGGASVLVANSMVMTHWNNAAILAAQARDPAYPYASYTRCGIALAIRADMRAGQDAGRALCLHVAVDIAAPDTPVMTVIDWSAPWAPFPD